MIKWLGVAQNAQHKRNSLHTVLILTLKPLPNTINTYNNGDVCCTGKVYLWSPTKDLIHLAFICFILLLFVMMSAFKISGLIVKSAFETQKRFASTRSEQIPWYYFYLPSDAGVSGIVSIRTQFSEGFFQLKSIWFSKGLYCKWRWLLDSAELHVESKRCKRLRLL